MISKEKQAKYDQLPDTLKDLYTSEKTMLLNASLVAKYDVKNVSAYVNCIGSTILGLYKTKDLADHLAKEVGVTPEVAGKIVADLDSFLAPVREYEANPTNAKQADLKALHQQFAGKKNTPTAGYVSSHTPSHTETKSEAAPRVSDTISESALETTATSTLEEKPAQNAPLPPSPTWSSAKPTTDQPTPEPDANTKDVVPMRTMEGDINRIHGYGAFRSQAAAEGEVVKGADQDALLQSRSRLADTPAVGDTKTNPEAPAAGDS